jgi:uncharacterized repeat protein (TIGR03803 family)
MILRKPQVKRWFSTATHPTVSAALLFGLILLPGLTASKPPHKPIYTVFHRFSGGDGIYPTASLIQDQSGNFYGTTWAGGRFDYGTVFKLEPSGKETVLHSFDGADGMNPMGGVVLDASGNLYGTTTNGGTREGGGCTHGCGTVFRIDRAGKHTVMHAFTGKADGGTPSTNLILDNVGNLYGTASSGGHFDGECFLSGSCGLVFKLDAHGNATVLYSFTGSPDGAQPRGGLVRDDAGNLYGTTYFGGTSGLYGTVFKLDSAGVETELYNFTDGTDGAGPQGTLVRDTLGNLYGVTEQGGDPVQNCTSGSWTGCGVVFKLDPNRIETTLYAFTDQSDQKFPNGGLLRGGAGELYGTTFFSGTAFKLDANGKEHVLHTFQAQTGIEPLAGVIMDSAGNLYGTTSQGGGNSGCHSKYGCGVVFKLTP